LAPNGGAANGIPLKVFTPSMTLPRTAPWAVLTTTCGAPGFGSTDSSVSVVMVPASRAERCHELPALNMDRR
jgi:hypothetical protein